MLGRSLDIDLFLYGQATTWRLTNHVSAIKFLRSYLIGFGDIVKICDVQYCNNSYNIDIYCDVSNKMAYWWSNNVYN